MSWQKRSEREVEQFGIAAAGSEHLAAGDLQQQRENREGAALGSSNQQRGELKGGDKCFVFPYQLQTKHHIGCTCTRVSYP